MTTRPTGDELLAVFTRGDLGGDEKLDLMEFTLVLEELGLSWTRAETQDRFERADSNLNQLARRHGVSRSTARAALITLETAGLVTCV
ncbi:helix-turn-helix domain-containing protein, partial [Actinomadura sp. NPDC048032]|uniref:helix-turn-helix domain-containing protein n=1 Tax=Actinomadura sp. NPDC048032 TaxID=3155747 RepID=UPI0033EDF611